MEHRKLSFALSTADTAPNTAPILLVGDICENLLTASRIGYQAIEVHIRENAFIDYETVLKISKENGVRIAAIVTGRLCTQEHISLTDHLNENALKAIKGMCKYIDMAANLKTDIIIGWIRGKIQDTDKNVYFKKLGKAVKLLESYAKEKDVKIFIEGINRYEIDSMNTAQEIIDFIRDNELKNSFVHLDTFHMNIEEFDICKAIENCGNLLGYFHVADSNRLYPGAGHLDFIKIFQELEKVKYKNYISVECLPYPNRLVAAQKALINIKKFTDLNETTVNNGGISI